MIEVVNLPPAPAIFHAVLGGESTLMRFYYSKSMDRYLLDITNERLQREANGLILNTGLDMLTAAGRLGLEALVPVGPVEATFGTFGPQVSLLYMDLDTYHRYLLGESSVTREVWKVPVLRASW